MRPLAMLLGVILGSTVSITVAPLMRTLAGSAVLAAIAGLGFYGELREQAWRRYPQFVLFFLLAFLGWWYWPTEQM